MKKRIKRTSKKTSRSLPSLIEEFAQLLREEARAKQQSPSFKKASSNSMASVVEQIAMILRKETHKKAKPKKASARRRSSRSAKKVKYKS